MKIRLEFLSYLFSRLRYKKKCKKFVK